MKVLIIDNYDSFTFNLYQYIGEILSNGQILGKSGVFEIIVKRNDEIDIAGIKDYAPDRIIISPGPGSPDDENYFGVCSKVIKELGPKIPLLGVCLGMQGIVHVFGGRIIKASLPMHGKTSVIEHCGSNIFKGIPNRLEVMRYHSLVAEVESLPECLDVTASVGNIDNGDYEIMGVRHREYPIFGIQFHPESFATEGGREIISNFLIESL